MKILLLGEYSGLFNNLKEGLLELGQDVTLISDGDGFKNYPSDYSWRVSGLGRLNPLASMIKGISLFPKYTGYDVVYVISPNVIWGKPYIGPSLFKYLKKHNSKVYLCGAGMTAQVFKYWFNNNGTKYKQYVDGYVKEAGGDINRYYLNSPRLWDDEMEIMSLIDGYIPIMYEYSAPFDGHPKLLKTIPIPINAKKYSYVENVISGKIRIFHGITKACKGGEYIIRAFEKLSEKYSKEAEFIVEGNIPFNEYIPYLKTMNVVVDDANAYSLGMNGLFSMSMGRIVLGGSEEQGNFNLGYSLENPAFNIKSNVEYIADVVENVIYNKDKFIKMGLQSRRFVEKEHDYLKIAQKYLTLWE